MKEIALKKHRMMTQAPIASLILKLSVPSTLSMLLNSLYGFANTWFLSRLGTTVAGSLGVIFSITSMIQALGFTLGNGAGSLLSRALGAKENEIASGLAALSFWLSLAIGSLLGFLGLIFLYPILRFLGATEGMLPYAAAYARLLFCAAPMMCASFVLNSLLRSEGKTVWSMIGFAVGNLLNILLDPLFIFTFDLGCEGASLATLISQTVAVLTMLAAYVFKKSAVTLRLTNALRFHRCFPAILQTGAPSLLRQGLASVASILLTRAAAPWGDGAIAGVSTVSRIFLLLYSFCLGIGQGLMPAAGYNKGAKNGNRAVLLYRFSLLLASAVMLALSIPTAIFAPQILRFFRPDPTVIEIGAQTLRAMCFVLPLHGCIAITNMFLQAMGNRFGASLIAGARQGIFFLPLISWLPRAYGLWGLTVTQAASDLLTFLLTIPFVIFIFQHNFANHTKPQVFSSRKSRPLRDFLNRTS